MKLNAPKNVTWFVSLGLAAVALICKFAGIGSAEVSFWAAFVSAAIALAGSFFSGL